MNFGHTNWFKSKAVVWAFILFRLEDISFISLVEVDINEFSIQIYL